MKEQTQKLGPEDPLLTAYALGELEGEDLARVEAALRADPGLAEELLGIRETCAAITDSLALEALAGQAGNLAAKPKQRKGLVLSYPSLYFLVGGLSAACFAVVVALHSPEAKKLIPGSSVSKVQIQLPLVAAAEASARSGPPEVNSKLADTPAKGFAEIQSSQIPAAQAAAPEAVAELPALDLKALGAGQQTRALAAVSVDTLPVVSPSAAPLAGLVHRKDTTMPIWGAGSCLQTREEEADFGDRPFVETRLRPRSRLGLETGGLSLAKVRKALFADQRPLAREVHIDQLLNAFSFSYSGQGGPPFLDASGRNRDGRQVLEADIEVAPAPWASGHLLARIGIQAARTQALVHPPQKTVVLAELVPAQDPEAGHLLMLEALRGWAERLRAGEEVALVGLGGGEARLIRAASPLRSRWELLGQIDALSPQQGTVLEAAALAQILSSADRLVLCSTASLEPPASLARVKAPLSVLLFGKEAPASAVLSLSDRESFRIERVGTLSQARAALLEASGDGAQIVARAARLELVFNPALVSSYRLLGYEDRPGAYSEAPATDLLSGQSFTALYELVPVSSSGKDAASGAFAQVSPRDGSGHDFGTGEARLFDMTLAYTDVPAGRRIQSSYQVLAGGSSWAQASDDFKLAASIAGFGMVLRDSPNKGQSTLAAVKHWSRGLSASVSQPEHTEFQELVSRAQELKSRN